MGGRHGQLPTQAVQEAETQPVSVPTRSRSPGRSMRVSKNKPTTAKTVLGIHIAMPTGSFCCLASPFAAISPIQ